MKNQTMSKRSFSAGQESYAEKALRKFPSIKRALDSSLMAKVGGGVGTAVVFEVFPLTPILFPLLILLTPLLFI